MSTLKIFLKFRDKLARAGADITSSVNIIYYILVDKRTPWYVKLLCFFSLSYAFSPVDIIPDFIPVLGYLDDLFIIPAMFYLARRLTPKEVYVEAVSKASNFKIRNKKLFEFVGTLLTMVFWVGVAGLLIFVFLKLRKGHKKL